MAEVLQNQHDE